MSRMSLGLELIAELGRRGKRGMYFDYSEYRQLRHVDSAAALASFLTRTHFAPDIASTDPAKVADGLRVAVAERDARCDVFAWLACDPIYGLLVLPFWLTYGFVRHATRTC